MLRLPVAFASIVLLFACSCLPTLNAAEPVTTTEASVQQRVGMTTVVLRPAGFQPTVPVATTLMPGYRMKGWSTIADFVHHALGFSATDHD